jgi:hypothetical protein
MAPGSVFPAAVEVIQRFDGYIAQYLGDGLLVYFSYPQAHEDDAQRAVHTGLGILDAMGTLNTRLAQTKGIRPEQYPPLTLSPQRQKQKTQEALVAWLLADAVQQPVLAVWEDLHWADPSTLEVLTLLLDQIPTARLLLVLTARPDFYPPWALRSYVTPLTLTRLTHPQVEEMVLRMTGGKRLPAEVLAQLVAKTDGIPLFVEELVKTTLETGLVQEDAGRYVLTGPLPPLAIPATLQDALMARLDRLAVVQEVTQVGRSPGSGISLRALARGGAAGRRDVAGGSSRASGLQPASSWRRSMAGSRRALTPLTCRKPGRSWLSCSANRDRCACDMERKEHYGRVHHTPGDYGHAWRGYLGALSGHCRRVPHHAARRQRHRCRGGYVFLSESPGATE